MADVEDPPKDELDSVENEDMIGEDACIQSRSSHDNAPGGTTTMCIRTTEKSSSTGAAVGFVELAQGAALIQSDETPRLSEAQGVSRAPFSSSLDSEIENLDLSHGQSLPEVTPAHPSPHNFRSLRISAIPLAVTADEFWTFLNGLSTADRSENSPSNVLARSLALDTANFQVATVSFSNEPEVFVACTSDRPVYLNYHHNGLEDQLVVDCDFFGLTTLYSALEPTVERVPSYCQNGCQGLSASQYRCGNRSWGTCFGLMEIAWKTHCVAARLPAARDPRLPHTNVRIRVHRSKQYPQKQHPGLRHPVLGIDTHGS